MPFTAATISLQGLAFLEATRFKAFLMFTKEVIFMNHQGSGEGQPRNTVMKRGSHTPLMLCISRSQRWVPGQASLGNFLAMQILWPQPRPMESAPPRGPTAWAFTNAADD